MRRVAVATTRPTTTGWSERRSVNHQRYRIGSRRELERQGIHGWSHFYPSGSKEKCATVYARRRCAKGITKNARLFRLRKEPRSAAEKWRTSSSLFVEVPHAIADARARENQRRSSRQTRYKKRKDRLRMRAGVSRDKERTIRRERSSRVWCLSRVRSVSSRCSRCWSSPR